MAIDQEEIVKTKYGIEKVKTAGRHVDKLALQSS